MDTFAWLAGTWSFERNGRVTTERWGPPEGGMMMGTSNTVAKQRTMAYEFLVIREDPNGDIFYVASPARQKETTFKLTRAGYRELVFENPEHDFPQKITYTLKTDGTLLAVIEGSRRGKTRRVEYPFRRVAEK